MSMKFLRILFATIAFLYVNYAFAQNDLLTNGMTSYADGDFVQAQQSLEAAYQKEATDFRITYWLANTYKALGQYQKARELYLRTVRLDPSFPPQIYMDLADVSLATGDYDAALDYVETAREKGLDAPYLRQIEGVALLNLEEHEDALNAFEDVAQTQGDLAQEAYFYAGITQRALENIEAAERSFQSALDIGRDDDLSVLARRQLGQQTFAAPKEHKPFTVIAGLSYQIDTNPTAKPNDEALVALANIDGERDQSKVFTLNTTWRPQTTGPWGFLSAYNHYSSFHEEFESQDVMSHTFTVAPSYGLSWASLSLPTSYNYTEVDRDAFLRQYTIAPTITIPFQNEYLLQLNVRAQHDSYAETSFSTAENRDSKTFGAGTGFYWFWQGQDAYMNLRADAASTHADGVNWDNDTYRLSAVATYPLLDKLQGTVSLGYTMRNFDNLHTTALKKRNDDLFSGTVALSYEVLEGLDLTVSNTYQDNNSNVTVYDYDRNITNIGIQKKWEF